MMINEPVIIDGIEVSCCDHYKSNGKCRIPHYIQNVKYTCCNCNEWDCYFKQLARKGQENEKLEKTLLGIKDIAEENIRIADLEGLNGVYRRGLAKQILQKIKDCKGVENDNRN